MKIFSYSKNNIILLIIIINEIFSNENELITLNRMSEITLVINGNDNSYILRKDYIRLPDEMVVNGSPQYLKEYFAENLGAEENTVILRWNDPVTNCSKMFADQANIFEIDLRNFDTSKIINMNCMFCGLPYLTSVDLSNMNTTSVEDMSNMFDGC